MGRDLALSLIPFLARALKPKLGYVAPYGVAGDFLCRLTTAAPKWERELAEEPGRDISRCSEFRRPLTTWHVVGAKEDVPYGQQAGEILVARFLL